MKPLRDQFDLIEYACDKSPNLFMKYFSHYVLVLCDSYGHHKIYNDIGIKLILRNVRDPAEEQIVMELR